MREVVEERQALSDDERVVVRQVDGAGAERMRCVTADAFAMKMSGAGTFSNAPVWCSPIQTSA